jgi:hypothetical protein
VDLLLHLVRSDVRLVDRLRAVLLRYYPAVVGVLSKLNISITLELIRAYPTPRQAAVEIVHIYQEGRSYDLGHVAVEHRASQESDYLETISGTEQPQEPSLSLQPVPPFPFLPSGKKRPRVVDRRTGRRH